MSMDVVNCTYQQFLTAQLVQLDKAATAALEGESFVAYNQITKQLRDVRAELDTLRQVDGDPTQMDEDEYKAQLLDSAMNMEESHLRVFVDAWRERHNIRLISDAS